MATWFNKRARGWIALCLCALMLFGCGTPTNTPNSPNSPNNPNGPQSGNNGSNFSSLINKDTIYSSKTLDFNVPVSSIDTMISSGERLYIYGSKWQDYSTDYAIVSCKMDGSDMKTIYQYTQTYGYFAVDEVMPLAAASSSMVATMPAAPPASSEEPGEDTEEPDTDIPEGEEDPDQPIEEPVIPSYDEYSGESIYNMDVDPDGNLVYVLYSYYSSSTEYSEDWQLIKVDGEGEELWRTKLTDGSWVNSMVCAGDKIVLNYGMDMVVYNGDGSPANRFTLDGVDWINSMYVLGDGQVYIMYYAVVDQATYETRRVMSSVDLQTGRFGEEIDVSAWSNYYYRAQPGGASGYDLIMYNSLAVAGWNVGDPTYTEILNFLDSDIESNAISNIVPIAEDKFLMTSYDWNSIDGGIRISELAKMNPDDIRERTVITLGCLYTYSAVSEAIRFNRENEEYRIKLIEYSAYNTDNDWEAMITRLNSDITSGKGPDILLIDYYSMPVDAYVRQGALEDLYPWIDNDPELNREDFLTNVMDAYTVDGKLYQLLSAFTIQTYVGKSSIFGSTPGWTLEDYKRIQNAYPDSDVFSFENQSQENMIWTALNYRWSQFVNDQKKTCSFDSPEFIELLEWVASFPKEVDYSRYDDDDFWLKYDTMYREDRTLLTNTYLYDFRDLQRIKWETFGEDVTLIGFPGASGSGELVNADYTRWAMSSTSANKAGAWQFIRYYLTSEYQNSDNLWQFPTRLDALQAKAEAATKPRTYVDENGETVEYQDYYWFNGEKIEMPLLTKAEVDGYLEWVKTIDCISTNLDQEILNLISEEAAPFFNGQKTAAEVAKIIQSRVGMYLAEQQ